MSFGDRQRERQSGSAFGCRAGSNGLLLAASFTCNFGVRLSSCASISESLDKTVRTSQIRLRSPRNHHKRDSNRVAGA